jgi:hypothetical protein
MTLKGLLMTQYYLNIINFQHYYTTKTVTIDKNKKARKLRWKLMNKYIFIYLCTVYWFCIIMWRLKYLKLCSSYYITYINVCI